MKTQAQIEDMLAKIEAEIAECERTFVHGSITERIKAERKALKWVLSVSNIGQESTSSK